LKSLARRLLSAALLLVLVSALSFLLAELAPGDFTADLEMNPNLPPQAVQRIRAEQALDQPLWRRYARWLKGAVRGDLGTSAVWGLPVGPLVARRLARSLMIVAPAWLLAWSLALGLGCWSAQRGAGPGRGALSALAAFLLALPQAVLALLFLALAARSGWFPLGGAASLSGAELSLPGRWADRLWHLALPVAALVLHAWPVLWNHVRIAVAEGLATPALAFARAQGLSARRLTWRHALPLALGPLLPLGALSFLGLLSSGLMVEVVLGWPGLGSLMLEAIFGRDLPLAVAGILAVTLLALIANGLADIVLEAWDPRARTSLTEEWTA
jgi:peptide/nickel transport system permease protein